MANEGYHEPDSEPKDEARNAVQVTVGAAPKASMAREGEPAALRFTGSRPAALAFSGRLHGMMVPSPAVLPRQSRALWQSAAA